MAITQKSFADYVKDLMSVLPTVNDNPMLSVTSQTDADKYRENPFYMQEAIRKRIAEEEAAKAGQSKSGMFGSMPSSGGDGAGGGRNYYQEIEDKFYQENLAMGATPEAARTLAERQAFEIQSANNARINAGLTLGANALIPGVGMFNAAKYGMAYPDFLQGNLRTMMGDSGGYQSPFTPKAAGIAAPVVTGAGGTTRSPAAIQEAIARAQAMASGGAPVVTGAGGTTRSPAAIQEAIARAQAMADVQPAYYYEPSGNALDWSRTDDAGNIQWSGEAYSPDAYSNLSDAFG